MVQLLTMKYLTTAVGPTYLRYPSLSCKNVVLFGSYQSRRQHSVRASSSSSYVLMSDLCLHRSCGSMLQSHFISLPISKSSTALSSKYYMSTKPTASDVVDAVTHTPTLMQDLNDNESPSSVPQSTTDTSSSKFEKECTESKLQASAPLVYESPLGNVVSKLRTVSLCTALIGMTGVPGMIALKGGTIPEAGILAAALLFVSGSMGSTAAIHFVFSPYVYKIEQIPIRICSTTSDVSAPNALKTTTGIDNIDNSVKAQNEATTKPSKDTLLKAWTRTLLLQNDAIIFDPTIDVQPYKGLRPMCNFLAKGRPLYVHPEYVYDAALRHAMNLDKEAPSAPKSNPDDDLF